LTIQELNEKIDRLKKVKDKSSGMQRSDLAEIIDDLETKRVELLTEGLVNLQISLSEEDISDLDNIANAFAQESETIENQNDLIDRAIEIGRDLVSLIS